MKGKLKIFYENKMPNLRENRFALHQAFKNVTMVH